MIYFSAFGEKNIPDIIVPVNKVNPETISKQIFGLELNDEMIDKQSSNEKCVGVNTYNIGSSTTDNCKLCGVVYGLEKRDGKINQLSSFTNAISYVHKGTTSEGLSYHDGNGYYLYGIAMPPSNYYVDVKIWGRIEITEDCFAAHCYELTTNLMVMNTNIRVNGECTEEYTDGEGKTQYSMKDDYIYYPITFVDGISIFNFKIPNLKGNSSNMTWIDFYDGLNTSLNEWSKKENIVDMEIYIELVPRPSRV